MKQTTLKSHAPVRFITTYDMEHRQDRLQLYNKQKQEQPNLFKQHVYTDSQVRGRLVATKKEPEYGVDQTRVLNEESPKQRIINSSAAPRAQVFAATQNLGMSSHNSNVHNASVPQDLSQSLTMKRDRFGQKAYNTVTRNIQRDEASTYVRHYKFVEPAQDKSEKFTTTAIKIRNQGVPSLPAYEQVMASPKRAVDIVPNHFSATTRNLQDDLAKYDL